MVGIKKFLLEGWVVQVLWWFSTTWWYGYLQIHLDAQVRKQI